MDSASQAALADAVRHAANNLSMVTLSNLDLLTRAIMPDSPASRQLERARQACERQLAILVSYTRLSREGVVERLAPEPQLAALVPLLEVAAGGAAPVRLTAGALPLAALPRPELDLALLEWVRLAAAGCPRGTTLNIALESDGEGLLIRLSPNPAGAAAALLAMAQAHGGRGKADGETAELHLPPG